MTSLKEDMNCMRVVYDVMELSDDKDTKIGAVIISYNSFVLLDSNCLPTGIDFITYPERLIRPEKYKWIEHAERNVIYRAARKGKCTDGSTLYTNGIPCIECARAIIQAGIKRVVYNLNWIGRQEWIEQAEISKIMFKETGVTLDGIDYKEK
jgi:dCMP deaminase